MANTDSKIQSIIREIEYEMGNERVLAQCFNQHLLDGASEFVLANSRRLMREKMQYIRGLASALKYLGFNVEFDISNGDSSMVRYYDSVKVA